MKRSRSTAWCLGAAVLAIVISPGAGAASAQEEPPRFGGSVEVVAVDANVVDTNGKPVRDLTAADFLVKVDGKRRNVLSADFVELLRPTSVPPAHPGETPPPATAATSREGREGRRVVLVMDRGELSIEAVNLATRAAARVLDQLSPEDRVALLSLPSGPRVDFTTDRAALEKALEKVGPAQDRVIWEFTVTLYEAARLVEGWSKADAIRTRECAQYFATVRASDEEACALRVDTQARLQVDAHVRGVQDRLNALEALCLALAAIPGPKVIVLVSGGFGSDVFGTATSLTEKMRRIATAAAAARVSLYTLYFSQRAGDIEAAQGRPTHTANEDRQFVAAGLEKLTGLAGGAMFEAVTDGRNAFERVVTETSGHYLIGLEPSGRDRDGKPHDIEVKVARKGVEVRARRQFVMTAASMPPPRRVHAAAPPVPPSPVRMTTHVLRGESDAQMKVMVAAEVDGFSDARLDVQIVDPTGKVVGTVAEELAGPEGAPVRWQETLLLTRGPYVLKAAAIAAGGKRVTAERVLNAELVHGVGFDASDLMLFESLPEGGLRVSAGDRIGTAVMPVYLELYLQPELPAERLGVTVEVETAEGLRRASLPLVVRKAAEGGVLYAEGRVDTWALPPGRYVARAVVTFGSTVARTVERAFEVLKK